MDEVERGRARGMVDAMETSDDLILIRPLFRKRAVRRIALNGGMHAWGRVGRSGDLYP